MDNRTIYTPNEFIYYSNYAEIVLYNRASKEVARAKIDLEDVKKCKERKWCMNDQQYVLSNAGEKRVKLHHFVFGNDMEVDHINRDTLDNRKENLRYCTRSQNHCNKRIQNNNTSGYKGVVFAKHVKKWKARVYDKGRQICVGHFDTKKEAALAYNEAAIKYYGEFARINEVA